jgi:hypothetical protein
MYNLLDSNESIIESNLSVEAAAVLMEHTNGDGFSYFYYPIDEVQREELKQDRGDTLRFLKPVSID